MVNKNKIYAIVAIFIILALLMAGFSVFLFIQIAEKSKEMASDKNIAVGLEEQFNDVEGFKKEYDNYKPNLERIDNLFVDSENPVNFIEFLEETASGLNAKLEMSPPSFLIDGSTTLANFQLSLTGGFPEIIRFSRTMESSPYLIKIKNLNIKNTEKNGNSKDKLAGQIKADFLIEVFAK
jgi:Tfp pilus assembly protein PilO